MDRKRRNILNFLGLVLLLVILPAGALIFLDRGIDYRKELLAELHDHGKMPGFSLQNYDRTTVDNNKLKNQLVIVNFMDVSQKGKNSEKAKVLTKLADQFHKREDIIFLNFISNEAGVDAMNEDLKAYMIDNDFKDRKQVLFVDEDPVTMERMAVNSFKMDFKEDDVKENALVALCDTDHTIRRHYNLLDEEEGKLLVKHIIMLHPDDQSREGDYDQEE